MIGLTLLHVFAILSGIGLVFWTLRSAIQTFVLPRGVSDPTARFVFLSIRGIFDLRASRAISYHARDRIMALYAPVALVSLTAAWLLLVIAGYTLTYWGFSIGSIEHAFLVSGSSQFTLGFVPVGTVGYSLLVFSQAGIGLLLAALLVSYLPVIYGAWSRRERAVATLAVRAGSPPTAWELMMRYYRLQGLEVDSGGDGRRGLGTSRVDVGLPEDELWPAWEDWFLDIEESHTSLSSLVFFRSPQADRSWVNAAGVILDAAALFNSAIDVPRNPRRDLCLRAGYIALRRIAAFFRIPFDADPSPTDPISISREEFNEVLSTLKAAGLALKPDTDRAWAAFSGWRVNYDSVLLQLAAFTMAPYAPWISDRSQYRYQHPLVSFSRRLLRW